MIAILLIAGVAFAGLQDRSSNVSLYGEKKSVGHYISMPELSTSPGTPSSGKANLYSSDDGNLYYTNAAGSSSDLTASSSGVANLDEAYDAGGAGAGREIAVDQGSVLLTGTHASNDTLDITGSTSGVLIDLEQSGAGRDIEGTSTTWYFSAAGLLGLANGATIDNASNNVLEWNENSEEILWTFETNALDLDSTSGVVTLNVFDGSTGTITHAADGAADDMTLSVTGAQNSSLIMSSSGTAADALQVTTTAGGIDITNGGAAGGEDLDIDGVLASVNINADEDVADAITIVTSAGGIDITADGAAASDLDLVCTNGSVNVTAGESVATSIVLNSSAGGIDITASGAAAGEDIDIVATGSSVNVSATEDVATAIVINSTTGGIDVTADGAAASDLDLTCTNGSTNISGGEAIADAVTIAAGAGGVDISSAATFDIDITATGGKILGVATEAAADQFKIDAQGTIAGDAINLETTDGGIMLNADGATEGDIELNAAASLIITAAEAAATAVAISSPAGGIDLTSAATFDIDITATGGRILGVASEAAADQFKIDAQGTVAGNAINLETTDGGVIINADGAANGDITIDAADNLTLTTADTLSLSGTVIFSGIQDIAAGGTTTAAVLTNEVITVGADAGGDIVTIANGTAGQIMFLICEDATGTTTITPATFNGGTSITFDALGDAVTLIYTTGTGWSIVGGNSYTII